MAWTTLSYAFGSLLTSTKMTQLYDNLTALASGSSGAPQLQTAAYADGSVTAVKIAVSPSLLGVQNLTSGTTYTPTVGTTSVVIHVVGGGGGGGKAYASTLTGGNGGGAGGYAIKRFTGISGTYAYAIGAGGAGSTGTGGGNGGNTTFTGPGALVVTAFGGGGALDDDTIPILVPGVGAVVSTNGDINSGGAPGLPQSYNGTNLGCSGSGGSTPFGSGGTGYKGGTHTAGRPGLGYGSGGGGGVHDGIGGAASGGAGAAGIIVVYEYR